MCPSTASITPWSCLLLVLQALTLHLPAPTKTVFCCSQQLRRFIIDSLKDVLFFCCFFFSGCTDYFNMHFTHHFCPSTYPCEISIWNLFCCQIMITGEAFNTDPFCAVTVSNQFLLQGLNPFFFLNVVGVPGTDCTVSLPAQETSFT